MCVYISFLFKTLSTNPFINHNHKKWNHFQHSFPNCKAWNSILKLILCIFAKCSNQLIFNWSTISPGPFLFLFGQSVKKHQNFDCLRLSSFARLLLARIAFSKKKFFHFDLHPKPRNQFRAWIFTPPNLSVCVLLGLFINSPKYQVYQFELNF